MKEKVAKYRAFHHLRDKTDVILFRRSSPGKHACQAPGLSTNEDAHANRVVQLDEGVLADYKIPVRPFSENVHVVAECTILRRSME